MTTNTATRAPAATLGAADYGRISSDPGHDEKGVTRQTRTNQARIAREPGWHHAGGYVDNDLSATKGRRRPEFERLLDAVRRGEVQVIVCYMSGRLLRNRRERMEVGELFAAHGVRVVCTNGLDLDYSTPAGRMMAGILGEVDTHEVEQAAARIKAAKRQAADEGRTSGGHCYGYEADPLAPKHHKKRLIVPEEAEAIRGAAAAVLAGTSMRRATMNLNGAGIKPLRAARWSQKTLHDLLVNPTIAGRRVYRGEDVGPADWEPTISYEMHLRLVGLLSGDTRPDGYSSRVVYLLSGIALCGKCGAPVVGRPANPAKPETWPRAYRCPDKSKGGCNGLRRPADAVDDAVQEAVLKILADPSAAGALLVAGAPDVDEVLEVQRGIDAVQARAAAIGAEMSAVDPGDEIGRMAYRTAMDTLREELDRLRRRQAAMSRSTLAEGLPDLGHLVDHWGSGQMTLNQKRAVIKRLVTVTFVPTGRGRKAGPEHIRIERKVSA
jgi:DNA invertase Pin-like site-specific DNA recombinase